MKLIILFLLLSTTTLLSAQSLSISYNTKEVQLYEGEVKRIKEFKDMSTIIYDFDNRQITISCEHNKVITIVDAIKTTKEDVKSESVQFYQGVGSISGDDGNFKILGGYSDTQTQIFLGEMLIIYTNEPVPIKI
jgi:hypothetical protein